MEASFLEELADAAWDSTSDEAEMALSAQLHEHVVDHGKLVVSLHMIGSLEAELRRLINAELDITTSTLIDIQRTYMIWRAELLSAFDSAVRERLGDSSLGLGTFPDLDDEDNGERAVNDVAGTLLRISMATSLMTVERNLEAVLAGERKAIEAQREADKADQERQTSKADGRYL